MGQSARVGKMCIRDRCMYSGRRIDLADLFAEGYDIDHIHPRSVVKDDSFDLSLIHI